VPHHRLGSLATLLLALVASGCSVRQFAVDAVGDSLATGPSVYESDDDLQLVGDALPFGIKFLETLVVASPRNRGLLLSTSRAYLLYAYGYVQYQGEQTVDTDLDRARAIDARAHTLYLRSLDYALRGIEVDHAGFRRDLSAAPAKAVARVNCADCEVEVALLYTSAAALAGAIGTAKQDAGMLARLAEVDALLERALALDESWHAGALHEFAVSWYGARPGPRDRARIERHYARALVLSGGKRAGPYVAYAEGVNLPDQDRAKFTANLERALAVDRDTDPNSRLQNALAQRRAEWLLGRTQELFLE
jgi:predicted anti-sigma-YlaC factor YlaD